MKLMCFFFGHKMPKGYAGGKPYLNLSVGVIDGIGRIHGTIMAKCDRCGDCFDVCHVHIPELKTEVVFGYHEFSRAALAKDAEKKGADHEKD